MLFACLHKSTNLRKANALVCKPSARNGENECAGPRSALPPHPQHHGLPLSASAKRVTSQDPSQGMKSKWGSLVSVYSSIPSSLFASVNCRVSGNSLPEIDASPIVTTPPPPRLPLPEKIEYAISLVLRVIQGTCARDQRVLCNPTVLKCCCMLCLIANHTLQYHRRGSKCHHAFTDPLLAQANLETFLREPIRGCTVRECSHIVPVCKWCLSGKLTLQGYGMTS